MTVVRLVVPCFNVAEWIDRTLQSIIVQTRVPESVLLIDDASTDGTGDASERCGQARWRYHRNAENLKMPHNLRVATALLDPAPDDVIVLLDGDDFLCSHAVEHLAAVFEDPDVWLTWGSYSRWPDPSVMPNPAGEWPAHVIEANSYRSCYSTTAFNHPLAFRAFLFAQVTDAELQDDNGRWFQAAYDAAIMFPMTELAGPDHARFLAEVTYVYNENNAASDGRVRAAECDRVHRIIRARPPRERLVGAPR